MSAATKVSYAVALRYAKALIDLAVDAKKIDAIEADLNDLGVMIESSEDLANMIRMPASNASQQEKAILALAKHAKFQDLTHNFLGVLAQNRRLNALEGIIEMIRKQLAQMRGEVTVQVQVAQDLTEKQIQALQDSIAKSIGKKVTLQLRVEPGILGGMIVTVGSHMIDDSVARKLERLQYAMGRQANENTLTSNSTVKEA